ncbi:MAG: family 16 glycoside hydrolase, partial [Candidatus Binatia bacterium]
LAQVSDDSAKGRFPLCVYDDVSAKDVAVSVKLRPISGEIDQAGGIVWRYRDRDNYYVVRANALEGNVVLYKVENGKRTDLKPVGARLLAYGKKVEVPADEWSELRVVSKETRHAAYFNGEHLFDVADDTFSAPGRVGLWTKADSVTRFDDLVIENLDGGSNGPRR